MSSCNNVDINVLKVYLAGNSRVIGSNKQTRKPVNNPTRGPAGKQQLQPLNLAKIGAEEEI